MIYFESCQGIPYSGPQSGSFPGRGGFLELGHFGKHFLKNSRKILAFFLLGTPQTTF